MEPEGYAVNAAGNARGILAKAEVAAHAAGVECSSETVTSDRPYQAILDAADRRGCDLIFMSSHGRRGLRDLFLGSQTQKVISNTRLPVLVATVESNQDSLQMEDAIGIVQNEHRAMAAVTCALAQLVADERARSESVDPSIVKRILTYIREIPVALHHPKEESYLFDRLTKRTEAARDVIATLQEQHKNEPDLIRDLENSLANWEIDRLQGLEQFSLAVNRYKDMLFAHIGLEEREIIPLARKHLLEEDWQKISLAFSTNGDPRFDEMVEAKYKKLFSEIINRADMRI